MKNPGADKSLGDVRVRIDEIDTEIARLVHCRATIVDEVRAMKASSGIAVYDPEREEEVIDRATDGVVGPFPRTAMRAVFREIISGCVALQEPASISYLGPPGTFTEAAALELFGSSATFLEASTIGGVLDSVARSVAAYGVVPFETSADGMVLGVVDQLIEHALKIRREYVIEVSYSLCSLATNLSNVETVYAHWNTLGQCRRWLLENLPRADLVVVESPAEAMVKALADGTGAALASQESGERAGLRVIANRTTDHADNAIRFVVVGRDDGLTPGSNRTTVAVKPRAGASLTSLFGTLSAHRVEMVRVASLPGSPLLVLELDGNRSQSNVASLLTSLVVEGGEVHVLGSYSAHRRVALSLLPSANPVGLR